MYSVKVCGMILALAAAIVVILGITCEPSNASVDDGTSVGGQITEDHPRFDCHTMGNMRCGVVRNVPIG